MTYLSIDVGTSAVKVAVVDESLNELDSASVEYRYTLLPGQKVELDPETLFSAIGTAAHRLDEGLRAGVEVVCYDTFSPSPVFLDDSGDLAHPRVITHLDRRSREQSALVGERLGNDRFLEITGLLPFVGGCGLLSVLWMQRHEPAVLEKTHRVGHLTTLLHHRLTGRFATDPVNASMFGAYETVTGAGWSAQILDTFDLRPEWFCEVRAPGSILGDLLPDAARLLGLRPGTPVAVGTNDMAAAHLGAGNNRAGGVMNTAGSSDMISILTDEPLVDRRHYLRRAALPGLWQVYATTAGGFALEWFREQLARDLTRDRFYGELVPRALEQHGERQDVTFRPYLTGDRQSLEPRVGSWDGLTLATTRDQMLGAMVTAMVGVLTEVMQRVGNVVTLDSVVKVSGGLATPPFLDLKRRAWPGVELRVLRNCSILGNVRLVQVHRG